MSSLIKRSNGIYYFVLYENGVRKWISTGERNKSLALKKLFPPEKSKVKTTNSTTFQIFIKEFLSFAEKIYAPGTVDLYRKSLNNFLKQIGNIQLSAVNRKHVDLYKMDRLNNVSPTTVNIELRTLRASFYTAVRWNLIVDNPFKLVPLCRIAELSPVFFTQEDLYKLITNIKEDWLKNIVAITALTGMRRGEILNLKWSEIDMKNKLIIVRSTENFRTKNGKSRIIPMNNYVYELLEKLSHIRNGDKVFNLNIKNPDKWLTRLFKRYIRRLGLNNKLHFHSLRHSFATWLVRDGASLYEVQKLLGHYSISTTQIYSHLATEELHRTVERITFRMN